jgi:hypothetical protein
MLEMLLAAGVSAAKMLHTLNSLTPLPQHNTHDIQQNRHNKPCPATQRIGEKVTVQANGTLKSTNDHSKHMVMLALRAAMVKHGTDARRCCQPRPAVVVYGSINLPWTSQDFPTMTDPTVGLRSECNT